MGPHRRTPIRTWELAALAALGALALVAYGPALTAEFVYDDFFFVVDNDAIKAPDRALEWLVDPSTGSEGKRWGTIFRPIRTLSYGLDYAGWRLNPVGYHLTSVLLHLVAIVAAWALARRVAGSPHGAVLGAAVFAVHPLPSEAVTWVGARADVLGAVAGIGFALLALRPGDRTWARTAAECGLLTLALACKEACAGVVPAVAVGRWLFARRPGAWRTALTWAAAPIATVLVYAVARSWLLGHTSRYGWLVDGNLAWTWLTVLAARTWDVGRVLAPADLSIDYSGFPYVRSLAEPLPWLAAAATAAAAWLAVRCRRVAPAVSFGMVWWVALLLPVSQIVPLNALIADRWLHLPFAGLACVIAAAVAAWERREPRPAIRRAALGAALLLVGAMATATFRRTRDWHDEGALWDAAVAAWPDSVTTRLSRGCVQAPQVSRALQRRDPSARAGLRQLLGDFGRLEETVLGEDRASRIFHACMAVRLPHLALAATEHGLRSIPDSFVLQAKRAEALWFVAARDQAEAAFAAVLARADAPRAAVDRVRLGEVVYVQPPGADPTQTLPAAARAVVRQRLARLRLEAGDVAGARAALARARAEWPESALTPCYQAQLEKDAGGLAAARVRMHEILTRDPDIQTAYVQAAEYALEAGDPAAVARILGPAVRRWPFVPELWALLEEAAREQNLTFAGLHYRARHIDTGERPGNG